MADEPTVEYFAFRWSEGTDHRVLLHTDYDDPEGCGGHNVTTTLTAAQARALAEWLEMAAREAERAELLEAQRRQPTT